MAKIVKYVLGISALEVVAITFQRRNINIIHRIVFQEQTVITRLVGIAHHHSNLMFRTMIIAFVVTFESTFYRIIVDIDRTLQIVGTRHVDNHNMFAIYLYNLHILISQHIHAYFFLVVHDVPEVLTYLGRIVHASYRESLLRIFLLQVFIDTH